MDKYDQYLTIRDNYINGNISDFKTGLKKLTKKQLLEFIQYWANAGNKSLLEVLGICYMYV